MEGEEDGGGEAMDGGEEGEGKGGEVNKECGREEARAAAN